MRDSIEQLARRLSHSAWDAGKEAGSLVGSLIRKEVIHLDAELRAQVNMTIVRTEAVLRDVPITATHMTEMETLAVTEYGGVVEIQPTGTSFW